MTGYDDAETVFNMFDADRKCAIACAATVAHHICLLYSGSLDEEELMSALSDFGLSGQDIEGMFMRMDVDSDGKVDVSDCRTQQRT